jgi:hypothetical protein
MTEKRKFHTMIAQNRTLAVQVEAFARDASLNADDMREQIMSRCLNAWITAAIERDDGDGGDDVKFGDVPMMPLLAAAVARLPGALLWSTAAIAAYVDDNLAMLRYYFEELLANSGITVRVYKTGQLYANEPYASASMLDSFGMRASAKRRAADWLRSEIGSIAKIKSALRGLERPAVSSVLVTLTPFWMTYRYDLERALQELGFYVAPSDDRNATHLDVRFEK